MLTWWNIRIQCPHTYTLVPNLKRDIFPFAIANEAKVVSMINVIANTLQVKRVYALSRNMAAPLSVFILVRIILSTLSSLAITLSMKTTFAPFPYANGMSSLFNLVLINVNVGRHHFRLFHPFNFSRPLPIIYPPRLHWVF